MAYIEVAREAGACWGVERALTMVEEALDSGTENIYTLGPLIHNPRVVSSLKNRGVRLCENTDIPAGSTLVLRTHGVSPELESVAHKQGLKVLDAVCPFVKKVHRSVEKLLAEGYQILIVGEAGHPEVEATRAYAPDALVVNSVEEVCSLKLQRRVGIVVQTTQSRNLFEEIVAAVETRVEDLKVENTICEATQGHQAAAAELASRSDVMIVIGGKNSANTTHLAEIAREECSRTYHIESPEELSAEWFDEAETIGITAGASTPAAHIEELTSAIEQLLAL